MTYTTMLRKALTNPKMEEKLKKRLGANLKRVERLAELHRATRNTEDAEAEDEEYRLAIELLREDQGGWILYGQSDPIPGDPWNLAHRFLEEYMQIRNFSEDKDNTEEDTKKLLEEADEFYYAAEYLTWFADGFVDLMRSVRTAG